MTLPKINRAVAYLLVFCLTSTSMMSSVAMAGPLDGLDLFVTAAGVLEARFFAAFGIGILRLLRRRAAPPKPHLGLQAGGAGFPGIHARSWTQYRSKAR